MKRIKIHNKIISYFEKILEKSLVLTKIYITFFKKMTLKEFSITPIPDNAKVLIIGCGSLPHTMIILGLEKKWKITGIDIDPKAVKEAKSMIKKYKLKGEIEIIQNNGLTVDLAGYDLIVVSYDVQPKDKMLERIIKDMDDKTLILYRTTWESFEKIYGKEKIAKNVNILKTFYRSDFIKSILMIRRTKE